MLQSSPSMVQPRCSKCGATMAPASVMPGLGWFSHRIFKCDRCGEIEILPESNSKSF